MSMLQMAPTEHDIAVLVHDILVAINDFKAYVILDVQPIDEFNIEHPHTRLCNIRVDRIIARDRRTWIRFPQGCKREIKNIERRVTRKGFEVWRYQADSDEVERDLSERCWYRKNVMGKYGPYNEYWVFVPPNPDKL